MAIAFDATNRGAAVATSVTVALTVGSGSNRLLIVGVVDASGDTVTGVKWNTSETMTQLKKATNATTNETSYIYGLLNPTSGSFNVVVSASASANLNAFCASYTGVSQSGLPDATASSIANALTAVLSFTTVADNCWAVAVARNDSNTTASSDSNFTTRNQSAGSSFAFYDTNGVIHPAGSYTGTFNDGGFVAQWTVSGVSFAPFVASASTLPLRALLGVGL